MTVVLSPFFTACIHTRQLSIYVKSYRKMVTWLLTVTTCFKLMFFYIGPTIITINGLAPCISALISVVACNFVSCLFVFFSLFTQTHTWIGWLIQVKGLGAYNRLSNRHSDSQPVLDSLSKSNGFLAVNTSRRKWNSIQAGFTESVFGFWDSSVERTFQHESETGFTTKPNRDKRNRMRPVNPYLGGKEWSNERVETAGAEVGDAEVDEREFLSTTHRPEVDHAAPAAARWLQAAAVARRLEVLRDGHRRATGQADSTRHGVVTQRRRPAARSSTPGWTDHESSVASSHLISPQLVPVWPRYF